jgi:hypothetical protein
MFQTTADSICRLTPSRRLGAGWIAPSLKEGVAVKVCPALPGVKRNSPEGGGSDHKGIFDE